jgi:hypothetical protein
MDPMISKSLFRGAMAAMVFLAGSAGAQQVPEAKTAGQVSASADQIAGWIRNLDADEFFTRETAMLQLLDTGPAVLPSLRPILTGGSLEATSRALFIVRQLGLTADFDAADQSGQLLAELAERKEAPALARRAAAALMELTQQRSASALAELERLGVKIARREVAGGKFLDDPVLSIEVGASFTGEETDLRRLKWIVDVPILIFSGKRVSDGWVKHAAAVADLQELHLYQTGISDEGLSALAHHANVREVGLYYTGMTDSALAPLAKLPLLSFVKLYGTEITKDGKEAFTAKTHVSVDYRRGAFLGVQGSDVGNSCPISIVHPGSPAEKAGLMQNDVIVRFGEDKVTSFGSLTDLISRCNAEDEVEVEVARGTIDQEFRKTTVKVKLAPWELDPAVRNGRR